MPKRLTARVVKGDEAVWDHLGKAREFKSASHPTPPPPPTPSPTPLGGVPRMQKLGVFEIFSRCISTISRLVTRCDEIRYKVNRPRRVHCISSPATATSGFFFFSFFPPFFSFSSLSTPPPPTVDTTPVKSTLSPIKQTNVCTVWGNNTPSFHLAPVLTAMASGAFAFITDPDGLHHITRLNIRQLRMKSSQCKPRLLVMGCRFPQFEMCRD